MTTDTSYLDVVREFMDSEKIIGGEYYTMKATYRLPDFDSNKTWIRCVVQKGNILVGFTANFKEEFEEELDLLEEGQEVTFRGRLYDKGFGFTDCELITN
jgi:hypothetical protein